MDRKKINRQGIQLLMPMLAAVNNIKTYHDLTNLIANLSKIGITTPITLFIHQDAKNSRVMVANLYQDGLGLPNRDYYLQNYPKLKRIKQQYQNHVAKM